MTNVPTRPDTPATLGVAQAALTRAVEHLAVWRHGTGGAQVAAGHDAISAIDATLRALHDTREVLVGEIRDEQDTRAVRVDAMLASYHLDREDPQTGEPLPRGVEGYRLGRGEAR